MLLQSYRDTVDTSAILRATSLRDVLFADGDMVQCPVFRNLVDWIGQQTGVPGY